MPGVIKKIINNFFISLINFINLIAEGGNLPKIYFRSNTSNNQRLKTLERAVENLIATLQYQILNLTV